jgi:hypothetical protein
VRSELEAVEKIFLDSPVGRLRIAICSGQPDIAMSTTTMTIGAALDAHAVVLEEPGRAGPQPSAVDARR